MVNDIKRKEILSIKEMLDLFEAKIGDFKNDMDAIDKKYREMAENEKKELKQNVAEYKTQLKAWQKMFNNLDPEAVKEVLGDSAEAVLVEEEDTTEPDNEAPVAEEPVEEKEESITDSIFPENNELEEEPVAEEEPENMPENEVTDDVGDFDEWPDDEQMGDGAPEELENPEASSVEEGDDMGDEWPDVIEEYK